MLATTTAPLDLTTITVERNGCGADVAETPIIATECARRRLLRTVV